MNQGVFRYAGVFADGSGTIEVRFNAAAKTFELRETYFFIDPLRSDSRTALGGIFEQRFVVSRTTPAPIPIQLSSGDYQGMANTRVVGRAVEAPSANEYSIQVMPTEILRKGSVTAMAGFSAHMSTASDLPTALQGDAGFTIGNLTQIAAYVDGKDIPTNSYGPGPILIEYNGAFTIYRHEPETASGELDFPAEYKTGSAAPTLPQFKQFLLDRHGWNSALVELQ